MSDNTTTTLIPHLCSHNASEAAGFYEKAFGARTLSIFKFPNGRVAHAEIAVNNSIFYLVDEMPEHGRISPLGLAGTPITLYLRVADCDTLFARAVAAGCKVQMPLQDMFWGDRYGILVDPYGYRWELATTIRQVSTEELEAAVSGMVGECSQVATTVS
jgi:PhnB protein